MATLGRIFNIQRFSIHDGPGIRTIVFFKGCPMRCAWCCNPESQSFEIEEMYEAGRVKTVGRDVTVADVMPEILADLPYYRRSGGGVTLSGGEVLCQSTFAAELLSECKSAGLHTAIESAATLSYDKIERLLPYLDLYLMDIKHMNSGKHREFTTHDNTLLLEHARRVAKSGVELVIRTPVVPGFNDTEGEILAIARFAKEIGAKEYHLLPYHRLGSDKYDGLSRAYAMKDRDPPEKEKMQHLLSVAERTGITCQIGG